MTRVLTDKAIVFADPELNSGKNGPNVETATGYHKLKMVMRGESSEDAEGRQRSESVSSAATASVPPSAHIFAHNDQYFNDPINFPYTNGLDNAPQVLSPNGLNYNK